MSTCNWPDLATLGSRPVVLGTMIAGWGTVGITSRYHSGPKSNWLHIDILRFSFTKLGWFFSINSSKLVGNFPAALKKHLQPVVSQTHPVHLY